MSNKTSTIALTIAVVLIIVLIGTIVYISGQYSSNSDLRDVAEQQELNGQDSQAEKTYEEKVRDGDIILR